MPDDEIKLIEINIIVGDEKITAAYVRPEKIGALLTDENSLGGFLREMLTWPRTHSDA